MVWDHDSVRTKSLNVVEGFVEEIEDIEMICFRIW